MSKKDREIVFNKFGGKCAYCGCDLQKGWHVDEIKPVRRTREFKKGYWREKTTKEVLPEAEPFPADPDNWEYVSGKHVASGCRNPENFHIDNQNPACASCNINKHDLSIEEFRSLILGFMNHLNNISTQYKIAKRYGLISENKPEVKFYFEILTPQGITNKN